MGGDHVAKEKRYPILAWCASASQMGSGGTTKSSGQIFVPTGRAPRRMGQGFHGRNRLGIAGAARIGCGQSCMARERRLQNLDGCGWRYGPDVLPRQRLSDRAHTGLRRARIQSALYVGTRQGRRGNLLPSLDAMDSRRRQCAHGGHRSVRSKTHIASCGWHGGGATDGSGRVGALVRRRAPPGLVCWCPVNRNPNGVMAGLQDIRPRRKNSPCSTPS